MVEAAEAPASKFAFCVNSPLSSIACDREGRVVTIGGRDILKLLEIVKDEKFQVKKNLRQGSGVIKQNTCCIEWNPNESILFDPIRLSHLKLEGKFAAGAVGGSFSVWDITPGKCQMSSHYKAHQQSTTKLSWHTSEENLILSAGGPGSIKLWDVNSKSQVFEITRPEVIREVKFNPHDPNYFVAGTDLGHLEFFDSRNTQTYVCRVQAAHTRGILSIDFNPKKKLFATGSLDKQIKIWNIQEILNGQEPKEKLKIQNVAGVGNVKWRYNESDQFCVSSFSNDNTLSIWDIKRPYTPAYVFRGHKEVITSFAFGDSENLIYTVSKDNLVIAHRMDKGFQPYKHYNKFGLTFDMDNTLALSNSYEKVAPKIIIKDKIPDIKPAHQHKNVYLVPTYDLLYDKTPFKSMKEELKYCAERTEKFPQDFNKIFECNAKLAQQLNKSAIANLWMTIKLSLQDQDSRSNSGSAVSQVGHQQQQQQQISQNAMSHTLNEFQLENGGTKTMTGPELTQLLTYYENNKQKFIKDQDKADRLLIVHQNTISVKKAYLKEIIKLVETQNSRENSDNQRQTQIPSLDELSQRAIIHSLQDIVNSGELQMAFFMFLALRDKIQFPEKIPKLWSQAYIDLLRIFEYYKIANKNILDCTVVEIRERNTNEKPNTFYARCGKCRKMTTLEDKFLCSNCNNFCSRCAVCTKPVKGLMLWCQICNHGGHHREIIKWFSSNSKCPADCQHNCYQIKKKPTQVRYDELLEEEKVAEKPKYS